MKIPDIDNVKLDVCETRRYSDNASINARMAPNDVVAMVNMRTPSSLKPNILDEEATCKPGENSKPEILFFN